MLSIAKSNHVIQYTLKASGADNANADDDLSHLGNLPKVRRVTLTSPNIGTPELTHHSSSRLSNGSGPGSLPDATPIMDFQGFSHMRTGAQPQQPQQNVQRPEAVRSPSLSPEQLPVPSFDNLNRGTGINLPFTVNGPAPRSITVNTGPFLNNHAGPASAPQAGPSRFTQDQQQQHNIPPFSALAQLRQNWQDREPAAMVNQSNLFDSNHRFDYTQQQLQQVEPPQTHQRVQPQQQQGNTFDNSYITFEQLDAYNIFGPNVPGMNGTPFSDGPDMPLLPAGGDLGDVEQFLQGYMSGNVEMR